MTSSPCAAPSAAASPDDAAGAGCVATAAGATSASVTGSVGALAEASASTAGAGAGVVELLFWPSAFFTRLYRVRDGKHRPQSRKSGDRLNTRRRVRTPLAHPAEHTHTNSARAKMCVGCKSDRSRENSKIGKNAIFGGEWCGILVWVLLHPLFPLFYAFPPTCFASLFLPRT